MLSAYLTDRAAMTCISVVMKPFDMKIQTCDRVNTNTNFMAKKDISGSTRPHWCGQPQLYMTLLNPLDNRFSNIVSLQKTTST